MDIGRINALVIRHMYLFQRSFPRLMDIFFWPIVSILTWGFMTIYLQRINLDSVNIVAVLLGAIMFWEFMQRFQSGVAITFLEEVWERNFLNIFVTPLKVSEFLTATVVLGIVRMAAVMILMSIVSVVLYSFNIFSFGFAFIPFLLILMLFGFALGIFNMAIILRFGTQAQVLAFGIVFLFQPFSAVFYPVSALPGFAEAIAWFLPPTYVFEGMRAIIETGTMPNELLVGGFVLSLGYAMLMIIFFYKMFAYVKKRGKLLKLD